jgi:hypothetical protein
MKLGEREREGGGGRLCMARSVEKSIMPCNKLESWRQACSSVVFALQKCMACPLIDVDSPLPVTACSTRPTPRFMHRAYLIHDDPTAAGRARHHRHHYA